VAEADETITTASPWRSGSAAQRTVGRWRSSGAGAPRASTETTAFPFGAVVAGAVRWLQRAIRIAWTCGP